MFCPYCNAALKDGAQFCSKCGKSIPKIEYKQNNTQTQNNTSTNQIYTHTTNTANTNTTATNTYSSTTSYSNAANDLVLANGETLVKTYKIASVKKYSANGYLTITTKRVIFHAEGGSNSFISKEVWLDKVTGLDVLTGTNMNVFGLLITILLLMIGCGLLAKNMVLIGLVLWAVAGIIAYLSIKRTYSFAVYGSNSTPSAIDVGAGAASLAGNRAIATLECQPTEETYQAVHEAGALILDLQTRGDLAVEDWKNR